MTTNHTPDPANYIWVTVNPARPGLKVPDLAGDFYDDEPRRVYRNSYITRRLNDQDIVIVPEPTDKADEPPPPPARRQRTTRATGGDRKTVTASQLKDLKDRFQRS